MALASLISGTNSDGYFFSLKKVAETFSVIAPVKSDLSQYRQKISYLFFREIFDLIVKKFHKEMKKYKGYHIVGFDGDDLNLPPTKDILKEGYRGYKINDEQEMSAVTLYEEHEHEHFYLRA